MTSLHGLIRSGDVSAVTSAIASKRFDVNAADDEGFTPLYLVAQRPAMLPAIGALLAAGAKVDVKGADKETPLYIAAFNNNVEAVQQLLQAGAAVNEINGVDKNTALHMAAGFGFKDLTILLLQANASVNMRNVRQETPLYLAAKANRIDTVYELLKAGANRTLLTSDSKDALYAASEKGHKGCVELLKADKDHLSHAYSSAKVEERNKPEPLRPTSARLEQAAAAAAPAPAGKQQQASSKNTSRTASPSTTAVVPKPPANDTRANASPAKKVAEQVAAKSPAPRPTSARRTDEVHFEATPVIPITVPKPAERTHDPLTGVEIKKKACLTMLEAGIPEPPKIDPEANKDFPELHARYGGTSMVVGTGTEERIVQRPMFDPVDGDVFAHVKLPEPKK